MMWFKLAKNKWQLHIGNSLCFWQQQKKNEEIYIFIQNADTCCCTGRQRKGFKKTRKDSMGTLSTFFTIGKFNLTLLLAAMNVETAIEADLSLLDFTISNPA